MSAATISGRIGPGEAVRHALVIMRRNLQHIRSDPEQLVGMTIQPLMFLVLFVYVFGGAIAGSSREYLQYALPGILIQGIAFTGFQTAIGLNVDFQRGLIDRFRSLPIARSAVVAGRIGADAVRVLWGVLIIAGFGMVLGYRFHGGFPGAIGGIALATLFGITGVLADGVHRRHGEESRSGQHLGIHDHPSADVRELGLRAGVIDAGMARGIREGEPDHEGGGRHPGAHGRWPGGEARGSGARVDGRDHGGVRAARDQQVPKASVIAAR